MSQPLFTDGRGLNMAMQISPPFDFDGATLRAFPLRANLYTLQKFVDQYLNIVPPEVARYRVFMPYVYMMVVNYGRTSVTAANMGWLAQREVTFSIPLEWYELKDGRWVFKDFAYVSPFIYVENELSMTTGREVYGWPKYMVWLDPELTTWMEQPYARPKLATVSTMVFPETYMGMRQEPRVFLEIEGGPTLAPLDFPPNAKSPFAPWNGLPKAITGSAALMKDWAELLVGTGLARKQPGANASNYRAIAQLIAKNFNPYDPNLYFNTVNLKQFRSADAPMNLCYQALTNTKMVVKALKRGGMLGGQEMMLGDPTGGNRVRLHRYSAQPIIETLGLEVAHETRGDGVDVATLEPVYPFWIEADMTYNLGETLVWRTKVSQWTAGHGKLARTFESEPDPGNPSPYPLYNTATGASTQEVGGPFSFPNATLRVLPILADPVKLERFVDDYLNGPLASGGDKSHEHGKISFEIWGRYVYVVATNYEGMASGSNNIGWWADRDLVFYVPVKWYDGQDPATRTLRSLALVPAYSYANSTTAAITGSEVSGIPMLKVSLDSPPTSWMNESGPSDSTDESLLVMTSSVLPALYEGQGIEKRVLLEVREGVPVDARDDVAWRHIAEDWGRTLKKELARRYATERSNEAELDAGRALALEVLANRQPINILTLKQFREAGNPLAACYQSVVQIQRVIERIHDIREIEDDLHVRIDEYPGQPIVDALGLIPKTVSESGVMRSYYFQAMRPMWMKLAMREELGVTVCRRAGSLAWEPDPATLANPPQPYFTTRTPETSIALVRELDEAVPQRLRAKADAWKDGSRSGALSIEEAKKAVETIEPQLVLESLLSREWDNWGNPRWWQRKLEIQRSLDDHTSAALPWHVGEIEVECLEKELDKVRALPFVRPEVVAHTESLLAELRTFVARLNDMERFHFHLREHEDDVGRRDRKRGLSDAELEEVVRSPALQETVLSALASVGIDLGAAPKRTGRKNTKGDGAPLLRLIKGAGDADGQRALILEGGKKLIEASRARHFELRDAIIVQLAKAAQKPDYCVPRGSIRTREQGLIFPIDQCWQGGWYVGDQTPSLADLAREVQATGAPTESLEQIGEGLRRRRTTAKQARARRPKRK